MLVALVVLDHLEVLRLQVRELLVHMEVSLMRM
jgi:hypothetical protein